MQQKQIFTKLISLKNIILSVAISIFVIYAVIGSIILLANKEALMDYSKIIGPLMIFAIATFVAVDNFHKFNNDNNIVKYLALASLILGPICVLLLSLMIWEAIPMYESSKYIYSTGGPTVAAKLIFSLTYLTVFAFLGSNALAIKDNNRIVHFMRFATFIFLAFAVIINIINIFSSDSDIYSYLRMIALSSVTWTSCVGLGCIAFFMSKVTSWEEKETVTKASSIAPAAQETTASAIDTPSVPAVSTGHVETLSTMENQNTEPQGLSVEPQNTSDNENVPEVKE